MSKAKKKSYGSSHELLERMRLVRPRNKMELSAYLHAFLGLKIPGRQMCAGHNSPMDYLAWSFLGPKGKKGSMTGSGDCVVWANRAGGKTQLGAIASLLECVFLPGCKVRILGGSEEQSQRMYEYLQEALHGGYGHLVDGKVSMKRCRFGNGSNVQVLSQSDTSVRGHHVQRLRCDEVDLFSRDIWQGAQFVTQSSEGISGRLEVLSTMHRPYGMMHDILADASETGMRVFRWCLWEVIEKCLERECSQCCLWEDCRGRAKKAVGYYSIDDAISQKQRSSAAAWKSEMLCMEPSRDDVVFGEFDIKHNVGDVRYRVDLPLYRAIDFGFSNPLACLFIQVDGDGRVFVIDEHIKSRTTLAEHARLIRQQYPYKVEATYCDPAGKQKHEITGTSVTQELAALGIPVRCMPSRILDGVEMIRKFLSPATGSTKLIVSDKCEGLIRAFQGLHYDRKANGAISELPAKDGVHDHAIDALRYFFVNHYAKRFRVSERMY